MLMPLEGVRVLDLTIFQQGPYATAMLADMGAEVIKIEGLPNGDPARSLKPATGVGMLPPSDINYVVELQSRGKKSLALDMRREESREVLYRLAQKSDVFVSNLRENRLKEWGIDYETLAKFNPQIIYALGTGYGPQGPDAELAAMDLAVQARGGLLSIIGEPECPPPPWGVLVMADTTAAMQLALAIMYALVARERTGMGQKLYTSILGGQLTIGGPVLHSYLFTGQDPVRISRHQAPNPLRIAYKAGDGKWVCFSMLPSTVYWPRLCRAIGMEELIDDPRFNTEENRGKNNAALVSLLDEVLATKSREEWLKIFGEHSVICGPVNTYSEVAQDPQVLANDYIITVDHPKHGPLRELGITIQLTRTPGRVRACAPEFGQHTEEVLLEIGGYTREELAELKAKGVIL